jgi:uncharacterized protein YprB with RNaseH-like and TPR domain
VATKILFYDLEVSDLDADWGFTICIGYKWAHESDARVISVMDFPKWKKNLLDDSRLWKEFMKVFNEADLTVGYYNSGFDRPYLYAKLLKHNLQIPANIPNVDLFYTVKANMKLRRKSMDNVTRYLDMQDDTVHKTPVGGDLWQRARIGDPVGIQSVIEHCLADILLTERLYYRLRPLMRTHPRIARGLVCQACGSNHLTNQGTKLTTTKGVRYKTRCTDCGHWATWAEADINEIDARNMENTV